jgi:HSP20 family protein
MVESSHKSGLFPSLMDPLRSMSARVADWFAPASEAAVNGSEYRIALELPGVAEEDIDVTVHDGVVSVSGKKTSEREEKGETYFFSERSYGSFSRSFRLPPDADARGGVGGAEGRYPDDPRAQEDRYLARGRAQGRDRQGLRPAGHLVRGDEHGPRAGAERRPPRPAAGRRGPPRR